MVSLSQVLQGAQKKGRFGDTMLAHINPEEAQLLKDHGGSGTINPETGLPEFNFFSKLFKGIVSPITASAKVLQNPTSKSAWMGVAKNATDIDPGYVMPSAVRDAGNKIEPYVLPFIPVAGPALAAAHSFGQNGNAIGALANAGASYIGQGGYGAVPSALAGAGASYLNGGNPLIGAVSGGVNGYMSSGGLDSGALSSDGNFLGTKAGAPMSGGMQGPTQGSGVLGTATRGLSGLGSALSTGIGGGSSSYGGGGLGTLASLAGGAYSLSANKKAQKDLENAGNNALAQVQPYQASGLAANTRLSELLGTGGNSGASDYGSLSAPFAPGDLTQDPGYQFQLQEGQKALDRQQAARGGYFSGAAIKQGQEFGQGLADQTYKDAFARDAQQKQQTYGMYSGQAGAGQNAAGSAAGIYENVGNAKAAAGVNGANIVNQSLSSLLSGSGAKRFLGYGQNGQPIYV